MVKFSTKSDQRHRTTNFTLPFYSGISQLMYVYTAYSFEQRARAPLFGDLLFPKHNSDSSKYSLNLYISHSSAFSLSLVAVFQFRSWILLAPPLFSGTPTKSAHLVKKNPRTHTLEQYERCDQYSDQTGFFITAELTVEICGINTYILHSCVCWLRIWLFLMFGFFTHILSTCETTHLRYAVV